MKELNVCIGSSCHIKGSYNVIQTFQRLIEDYNLHNEIEFKAVFCLKQCGEKGVAVKVDDKIYHVEPEKASSFFKETFLNK